MLFCLRFIGKIFNFNLNDQLLLSLNCCLTMVPRFENINNALALAQFSATPDIWIRPKRQLSKFLVSHSRVKMLSWAPRKCRASDFRQGNRSRGLSITQNHSRHRLLSRKIDHDDYPGWRSSLAWSRSTFR